MFQAFLESLAMSCPESSDAEEELREFASQFWGFGPSPGDHTVPLQRSCKRPLLQQEASEARDEELSRLEALAGQITESEGEGSEVEEGQDGGEEIATDSIDEAIEEVMKTKKASETNSCLIATEAGTNEEAKKEQIKCAAVDGATAVLEEKQDSKKESKVLASSDEENYYLQASQVLEDTNDVISSLKKELAGRKSLVSRQKPHSGKLCKEERPAFRSLKKDKGPRHSTFLQRLAKEEEKGKNKAMANMMLQKKNSMKKEMRKRIVGSQK
jgi:hypothetical protein